MKGRRMGRRAAVRVIAYIAAAFAVTAGIAWSNYAQAQYYKLQLNNTYQRAFAELTTNMSELDTALQKGLYATTPAMAASLCTEIYGKATAAQMAVSQLSYSHVTLENTASFLSTVGDYAYVLSKNAASGAVFGETEENALRTLADSSAVLAQNLQDLQQDINSGVITLEELNRAQSQLSSAEAEATSSTLDNSFRLMESEFPEMPTLIYDGPFSEHIETMEPLFLQDKDEVTDAEAMKAAAEFLGIPEDKFRLDGESEGKLPTYLFSVDEQGSEISLEVTKRGGVVLNLCNSRAVPSTDIRTEDAVAIAKDFLTSNGMDSMKESYYTLQGNIITINFAYVQDGVICYPDLVKVALAMDDGGIIGYDAKGYIMSHTARSIPAAAVSEEEAKKLVASDLTVLAHQMTVIPTEGKYEIFCHEFKCETADGRHYIIYVNAVTGQQAKILILIESENGTLTM